MRPLPHPPVQLVTGAWLDTGDLVRRVEAALRGGLRWVQLRAKDRSARELLDAARLLAPLAASHGALLVVNDRADVALAAGAGGVHLPEAGLRAADARSLLGPGAWIARSMHGADALGDDDARILDAVQFGPVHDTASKRAFGPPQGLDGLAAFCRAVRARGGPPVIAVGGIDTARVADCRRAGAAAVAVIGAVWEAHDVEEAARAFASCWPRALATDEGDSAGPVR